MESILRIAVPMIAGLGWIAACTVEGGAIVTTPEGDGGVTEGGSTEIDAGEHGECPHTTHEFSYEESETTGPTHWKDIQGPDGKPKYEACGGVHDGGAIQQSPIELQPSQLDAGGSPFELALGTHLSWGSATVSSLWNNGHTWQAGFLNQPLTLLANGGTTFTLRQFHFHAPAEHAIGGKEHPLEMHFVHLAPSGNAFEAAPFAAVVGVMFDEDPEGKDNVELAKIWDRFSKCGQEKEEPVEGVTLNLGDLLPPNMSYVMYDGSLTTPPCSVTVRFHILTNPILASKKQIDALTHAVGRNDRPHQPLLPTTNVTLHEHVQ
jgi:carbonic anhydrase